MVIFSKTALPGFLYSFNHSKVIPPLLKIITFLTFQARIQSCNTRLHFLEKKTYQSFELLWQQKTGLEQFLELFMVMEFFSTLGDYQSTHRVQSYSFWKEAQQEIPRHELESETCASGF